MTKNLKSLCLFHSIGTEEGYATLSISLELSNPNSEPFFVFKCHRHSRDHIIAYDGKDTQFEIFCSTQSSEPNFTMSDKYVFDYAIEDFALETQ